MIFLWVFSCWGAIIFFIVRNNMRGNKLKKRVDAQRDFLTFLEKEMPANIKREITKQLKEQSNDE